MQGSGFQTPGGEIHSNSNSIKERRGTNLFSHLARNQSLAKSSAVAKESMVRAYGTYKFNAKKNNHLNYTKSEESYF